MLRSGIVISLHTMRAEGKSIREIARQTGHFRKLDPFKPFLEERYRLREKMRTGAYGSPSTT